MKLQIVLGSVAGLVVGLMCWRGNQSANLVSTFPDALTFVALGLSLAVAIHVAHRRSSALEQSTPVRVGVTVATAAGVVFGAMVVGLGFVRFANPAPVLLAFGFLTALGSSVAWGIIAALVSARSLRPRAT